MKIIDAYILARTKRKTRRIRTALVVIVSSLLFAILFAASFMLQGIRNTANQVKDVGFNSRNMVTINDVRAGGIDFMAEQKKIEDAMAGELRARGIKVTSETKLDPSWQGEFSRRFSKIANEYVETSRRQLETKIQELGSPTALYHFSNLELSGLAKYQADPALDPLAEELKKQEATGGGEIKQFNPFEGFQFFSAEAGMMRSQVQPGYNLSWEPGQPYPLVISYAYLEELADRSFAKATTAEKNKAYRELMQTYSGKVLEYCYRNMTAQDQLRTVVHYNYTAANDKDSSTKPIDVPVCANFDQKLLKKLKLIDDQGNSSDAKPLFKPPVTPAPDTRKLNFKIVGFVPSSSQYGGSDVISQIFTGINTLPTPPQSGIVPAEVLAREAVLQNSPEAGTYSSLFGEFKTREAQKAFIDKSCGDGCGKPGNENPYIAPFGSVSVALESTLHAANKFLLIAMGVIMFIAALMIMFTISKVIADSTKEIAVFRSLGARRRDIAQIYYTYGLMLASASVALALVIAVISAKVMTSLYHERIENALIQAVGAYNTDVHATLFAVNLQWTALIAGAMIVAALLGITVPILASLRRKLINILREE